MIGLTIYEVNTFERTPFLAVGFVRSDEYKVGFIEPCRVSAKVKFELQLNGIIPDEDELMNVKGVLVELLPRFASWTFRSSNLRPLRKPLTEEQKRLRKRISDRANFAAYFRYELPNEIFSYVEMASFLKRIENSSTSTDIEKKFADVINSMEKGSPKRDDFLRKLSEASIKSISLGKAVLVARTAMKSADKYIYDSMFPSFGEAGHVLRLVLWVAKRLPQDGRIDFMSECIRDAADDTMAFRILTILTKQEGEDNLHVSAALLYPAFRDRMRSRYGRSVNAETVDLTTSDLFAFNLWGSDLRSIGIQSDPEDKAIQRDFWLRYIGKSKSRLAKVFREILLPVAVYQEDPALAVANKIPIADLRNLFEKLPEDSDLTDLDRHWLLILKRLLAGEFKDGIGPTRYFDLAPILPISYKNVSHDEKDMKSASCINGFPEQSRTAEPMTSVSVNGANT